MGVKGKDSHESLGKEERAVVTVACCLSACLKSPVLTDPISLF